jgi:hypothetical protein
MKINKNINERLSELYTSRWKGLCTAIDESDRGNLLGHPHLLRVDEEAAAGTVKVMIFLKMQPDNDWYTENMDEDLRNNLSLGDLPTRMEQLSRGDARRVSGQGMARFTAMLEEKVRQTFKGEIKGSPVYYVWNNLVKIGSNNWRYPDDELYEIERLHFPVIPGEIDIIRPDIILFLTGPARYFENKIDLAFGQTAREAILENHPARQLARLSMPGAPDVKHAYRAYAASYLNRTGLRDGFFKAIIDDYFASIPTAYFKNLVKQ